jgi:hypothetical protein
MERFHPFGHLNATFSVSFMDRIAFFSSNSNPVLISINLRYPRRQGGYDRSGSGGLGRGLGLGSSFLFA